MNAHHPPAPIVAAPSARQAYLNRGNAVILRTLHHMFTFYSRRRRSFVRLTYVLIIYVIFATGNKKPHKKQREKQQLPPPASTSTSTTPNSGGTTPKKTIPPSSPQTPLQRIHSALASLVTRVKSYPAITLLSQFSLKDKRTHETLYQLTLQIALLFVKAFLSLKIATIDGNIVSSLISRKFKRFFKFLLIWLLMGIPSTMTNALLEKSKRFLAQSLRVNITTGLLDKYLPENGNSTLYQLLNEDSEDSIPDPNHRLTTTVDHFTRSFSILPSQILTPTLDILIAANHMAKASENASEGALVLGLVANVSTFVLRFFTPNFSMLNKLKNTLENKFMEFHSNVITNNEEIALAKGHGREIDILDTSYFEFEKFERMSLRRMAVYNFAVSFIFKYSLGAVGLMVCAIPTFSAVYENGFMPNERLISQLSSDFVANRSLLLKASESLGKLIQSKKNLQNMKGYAEELWEFQETLVEINENAKLEGTINGTLALPSNDADNDEQNSKESGENAEQPLLSGPNVEYGDEITFNHVPLITPKGNVLVKDLTFTIKPGDNLLIIGPNGCGKSSLFRILGGLWDVQDPGKLVVPYSRKDLFYLPQRSYFTYGTLREQIIYPQSYDEYRENILQMKKDNSTSAGNSILIKDDEYLVKLLHQVNLDHLLEYHEDSDSENEDRAERINTDTSCLFMLPCLDRVEKWPDLLSVGEQQRLAMIRLYYHQPKFAVLDECTSSISSDLERECYRIATQDLKITVLSVCHRTSLWSFHSKILKFTRTEVDTSVDDINEIGAATTLFTGFDPEVRLQRHEEMISIDNSLKRSEDITKRLESLMRMKSSKGVRKPKMYIEDADGDDNED